MTNMNTNTSNPWIGLDSYREGQILYGRSREIRDLSMAVFYNRQTVVYGRSGIGKSSLLHAGIFPEARLRGCLPVSVRFDHSGAAAYSTQLFRAVTDAVTAAGGTMHDMVESDKQPDSLWEFFHRFRPEKDGKELIPLIVVDQFEEIFTLGKKADQVRAFFDQLADLLNDVMPAYLQSSVSQTQAEKSGSMFDGLDFHMPDNRYMQETAYRLVLVLREDYLSYLERYSGRIPALKQNRYGLLPITCHQAIEVITQPRPGLVSKDVADTIIRQVVTEEQISGDTPVDSAILSLFLSRLYEKKGDEPTISRQLVEEQGDALLQDFYAEIVEPLDKKTVWFLEDTLINADGHRENVTVESLYKNAWLQRDAVEKLEHSHLLRLFSYGNVQRVEFAHDVLCPIIVRRRDQRVNEERYRRSRRRATWIYLILFVGFFIVVWISAMTYDMVYDIRTQRSKLHEVEASLIERGSQKMLDNHDIYGAIQLLLNSIDDNVEHPSKSMAKLEKVLRQAVDSLYFSKDSCVANMHYNVILPGGMTLSPSKRLVAINDMSERVFVVDSRTGSIVQAFSRQYPVQLFDYSAFSASNSSQFEYYVKNGQIIASRQKDDEEKTLVISDIHPNDNLCLITDHRALYECFIPETNWSDNGGSARLCIHDFPTYRDWKRTVADAVYDPEGKQIAIALRWDSIESDDLTADQHFEYYLYSTQTGKMVVNDTANTYAQKLIEQVEDRREKYSDKDDSFSAYLSTPFGRRILFYGRQAVVLLDRNYLPSVRLQNISLCIHPNEQISKVREHLDTLSTLPDYLTDFTRSFDFEGENPFAEDNNPKRHEWPLAASPDLKRLVLVRPPNVWAEGLYRIYGLYTDDGSVFFKKILPNEVHTIYFTEDGQYLVVNYGEETQEEIYLPPLEKLTDQCKSMFFDWQMSEDERYQTYLHMND